MHNVEFEGRKLTKKQRRFVQAYVRNGGIGGKAVIEAGYAEDFADQTAHRILRKPWIQAAVREEIFLHVDQNIPGMLNVLKEIALDHDVPPQHRTKAAEAWLDRSSSAKLERHRHDHRHKHEFELVNIRDIQKQVEQTRQEEPEELLIEHDENEPISANEIVDPELIEMHEQKARQDGRNLDGLKR